MDFEAKNGAIGRAAWQHRQLIRRDGLPLGPEEGQGGDGADLPSRNESCDLNLRLVQAQAQRKTGPISLALQTEIGSPNPWGQG
jgi:hypothetical protein